MNTTSLKDRLFAIVPEFESANVRWTDVRLSESLAPFRAGAGRSSPARQLLELASGPVERLTELGPAITSLDKAIRAIKSYTAEEEFEQLIGLVSWPTEAAAERNREIVRDWVMVTDAEAVTLADLGEVQGLTRERIRQLINLAVADLTLRGAWMPSLTLALELLYEECPIGLLDTGSAPYLAARLGNVMSARALLRWGEVMGQDCLGLSVGKVGQHSPFLVVATQGQREELNVQHAWMRKALRRAAVMSASELAKHLSMHELSMLDQFSVDPQFVSFELDGVTWVSFGDPGESRLAHEIRRVLSVVPATGYLPVGDLLPAIRRDTRGRGAPVADELSIAALNWLLDRMPDVDIRKAGIRLKGDLVAARKEYLGEREREIYDAMAANGGTMGRSHLVELIVGKGDASEATLGLYLFYWTGIERVQRGVFRLVGWPQNHAAVESAAAGVGKFAEKRAGGKPNRADPTDEVIEFDYCVRPSVFTVKRLQVPWVFQDWFSHCPHRRFSSDQVPGLVLGTNAEAGGMVRLRRIDEVFKHLKVKVGEHVKVQVSRSGSIRVDRKAA